MQYRALLEAEMLAVSPEHMTICSCAYSANLVLIFQYKIWMTRKSSNDPSSCSRSTSWSWPCFGDRSRFPVLWPSLPPRLSAAVLLLRGSEDEALRCGLLAFQNVKRCYNVVFNFTVWLDYLPWCCQWDCFLPCALAPLGSFSRRDNSLCFLLDE